jgi:DNA-binding CsgD family transcriptional regulator
LPPWTPPGDVPAGGAHRIDRAGGQRPRPVRGRLGAPAPARRIRRGDLDGHRPGDDASGRAALRVDGAAWALVSLYRERGRPAFDADEIELLAGLSAPLAEAVRERARPGQAPTSGGVRLPIVVISTLMCARAVAARRENRPARARLRAPGSERWLVCHASCLRDADGRLGDTALVIEAAQAAEIAPIVVQAYALSPRERQITELIAQGVGTGDIAARLHLSAHTVRDYVKAVFDKVGVSSRGELVAKLFAEHYAPLHLDPSGHERVSG